jgi:hypothetical protein
MVGVDLGPTRQSRRDRTKTMKALEQEEAILVGDEDESNESGTETTIRVSVTPPNAPGAPRSARTVIMSQPKNQAAPTRARASAAKAAERLAAVAASTSRSAIGKASTTTGQHKVMTDLIAALLSAIEEQKQEQMEAMEQQRRAHASQIETLTEMFTKQIETLKAEVAELIQTQWSNVQKSSAFNMSYVDVARTPPSSLPSNVQTLTSMGTTPSTMTDTLYCTIDTSRMGEDDKSKVHPGSIRKAIEEEIRTADGQANWRCAAVIKDSRNAERIRVACRDEAELRRVKEAAQKTAPSNARVLHDQLYPVKVNNANRAAILDHEGNVLPGATEVLGKENEVSIAKIAWLSRKDQGKAYGSMVVYVTKGSEAVRLLQGQYFHVAGESAYTGVYEHRVGPTQCYNCQEIGHKAYACTKKQICAKCATEGHGHKECSERIAKCALCKGPHESFSKSCRLLHRVRIEN